MKRKTKNKWLDLKSKRNFLAMFVVAMLIVSGILLFKELMDRGEVSSIDFSSDLESRINRMVSGYPIEEMVPYIAKEDRVVAAFLVAIAKKESNWGKYAPEKNGKTCYNYWGYRGTYNQTDSGYSCFDSPEQAVEEVGGRIKDLVQKKIDSPKKMVIAWKCGFDCSGHSFFSVKKWEWDVGFYFNRIYD